ncbi:metallophosphoesterase family protein [Flammeovirga pacifica]|uniref:Calcineurin-like phosphoesterase domain-containing protein n=1 Tax=Flammeovirga pacifica TaxID=915059 RepID=A0A1S1YUZ4_FLAPC|nr:metallophosphoesterase family protein [Flammeovirga pacifica]OHX64836.1 hypothetical protein NH26_00015 [Flammeovirga pacifica]
MKKLKLKTEKYIRRFAIGDVHGCLDTLKYLLEEQLSITPNDFVVLLGDYIHKGPKSFEVIEYIIDLQKDGYSIYTIRGNHEQNLINKQKNYQPRFMRFVTQIFNPSIKRKLLNEDGYIYWSHKEFLNTLPYQIVIEDFHFTHAGFDFDLPKPKKGFQEMLTVRKPLPEEDVINHVLKKKRLVHGHTPTYISEIEKTVDAKAKVINLDSGCAYAKRPSLEHRIELGFLSCLNLNTFELIKVKNRDQHL